MLKARLIMGTFLAAGGIAVLFFDESFAPYYPIGLCYILFVTAYLGEELRHLVKTEQRPPVWLLHGCLAALILSNWPANIWNVGSPFAWIVGTLVGIFMLLFLYEGWKFREPGGVTERLSVTFWMICYVPLLFCFLCQLRWLKHPSLSSNLAMALVIFLPKCCDSGAYFAGRAFGKHKMTPVLSPKKTWEGAVGGLLAAMLFAFLLLGWPIRSEVLTPRFFLWVAIFGIVGGVIGIWGDLMESLIKRDLKAKDAGQSVPGFGGLLDVFDSILFTAPVLYLLIHFYPGP